MQNDSFFGSFLLKYGKCHKNKVRFLLGANISHKSDMVINVLPKLNALIIFIKFIIYVPKTTTKFSH